MKVNHKELGEILLPDFLLVGAAKSATSSLYSYLAQHPEIRMSKIKENWFFSFFNHPPHYTSPNILHNVVSELDEYVKLYEGATAEQRLGDASPSYLYTYQDTIRNIQAIYPPENLEKLKIIISLREPVSRAFSQYRTFRRVVDEPLSFSEAVDLSTIQERLNNGWNVFYDYTGFGYYYKQVKAFIDAFGKKRVLVVLYDDIQKDPAAVCKTIYDFLDVDASFDTDISVKLNTLTGEPKARWVIKSIMSHNPVKRAFAACIPTKIRLRLKYFLFKTLLKKPVSVDEDVVERLAKAYVDDVTKLEAMIGRDLSSWRSRT